MVEEIRITVLMGIYNCAATLDEALESLYAQTYQGFKVILCDDGSTDNTYEVARRHAEHHPNVFVVRNERNMGLNYTLNHCLEYADTEYCARMDGDDISLPTRFETEIKFLDEHPEYDIVSGPMNYFDEGGIFRVGHGKGEITKKDFIHGSPICHAPCMVRTKAYKAVKGYTVDKRLLRVEDYHLWFKMYATGRKAYMLKDPIYSMRDDRNAISRRNMKGAYNEFHVRYIGFKMLHLPLYSYIYTLRPLIVGLLPKWLYLKLHKRI